MSECDEEKGFWATKRRSGCKQDTDSGTCVFHVMCHTAGARSTRRLMTIHPRAPEPSAFPRLSNCTERCSAHSSWMGTLYDNHSHFLSEDNTQGSLPKLNCSVTGAAYGVNFVKSAVKVVAWPPQLLNRCSNLPQSLQCTVLSQFLIFYCLWQLLFSVCIHF